VYITSLLVSYSIKFNYEDYRRQKKTVDPELADERDIQMEYSSD
jgi:hypothetical protein